MQTGYTLQIAALPLQATEYQLFSWLVPTLLRHYHDQFSRHSDPIPHDNLSFNMFRHTHFDSPERMSFRMAHSSSTLLTIPTVSFPVIQEISSSVETASTDFSFQPITKDQPRMKRSNSMFHQPSITPSITIKNRA